MSRFWFSVVSILCQKQNLGKENTEKIYFIVFLLFEITFNVYAINSVIYINILFIFRNHKKVFFVYKTLPFFLNHITM